MIWLSAVITLLLLAVTLLPLSRNPAWWVRGADFPRIQFAAFGLLNGAAALLLSGEVSWPKWTIVGLNVLVVSYQLYWIFPYTVLIPKEAKDAAGEGASHSLSILSVNVLMTNRRADLLLEIVKQAKPDVLVTLETDAWWQSALRELETHYPHRLECPLENTYGMHLYCRFPLEDPKIQFLVEKDVPSMHTLVALPTGCRVCLHIVHPAPPSPTENETSKERDAELVMVGASAAHAKFPVIVSGDLNDVAWSATTRLFRKVSHLLDPRIGRGMYNTYHAGHLLLRWPVDHFFHSRHFTLRRLARLAHCGSDHFPVFVELDCDLKMQVNQSGLNADAEDKATAREKLGKKSVSPVEVHRPGEGGQRKDSVAASPGPVNSR